MRVKALFVGTCGFPTSRYRYYSLFNVVELQETFYDMPTENKVARLRSEAPQGFRFAVKVFQGLTHSSDSPTWRRMRRTKLVGDLRNYGILRPTRDNLELWGKFVKLVKPLDPAVVVFQTPPSLKLTEDSAKEIMEFYRSIESIGKIAWEPRGATYENMQLLEKILRLGIIHVVDPFRRDPLIIMDTLYFRLHGIGGGEVNYSYKYTDNDLRRLIEKITRYNAREIYVLFNNTHMLEDAVRLKELITMYSM